LSKSIHYGIALILCGFLIALSSRIIDDIDRWEVAPTASDYTNQALIDSLQLYVTTYDESIYQINEKKSSINNTLNVAQSNYANEKKSFDNWLEARKTVGSPKEDTEVLSRAQKLDKYYAIEQEWRKELTALDFKIDSISKMQAAFQQKIYDEQQRAETVTQEQTRSYDIKVFLIRLLFVLPILGLGLFFILRFRKHKYWPVFLGFVLFSFYAFFVGLVPYLPSYGGYVRYTVGIVLSLSLGVYAINKFRAFVEKNKAALKTSSTERAKLVESSIAEKALKQHICPSCGKDFILPPWDKSLTSLKLDTKQPAVTSYCRYCGMVLFVACEKCEHTNFAHLPFCSNCGESITKKLEN
jgi:predicted RNA-binding Zn-ribbon protein involved in translation (DUF1610 family)